MDRGAMKATVYGIAKESDMTQQLKQYETNMKHMRQIMMKVKAHLGVKRVGGVGVLFYRGQGGSLWSLKSS